MIGSFFNSIIESLRSNFIAPQLTLFKLRAAIWYLEGVRGARRILMLVCALVFVITMIGAGLVLVPVALIFFMPWDPVTKAYVGLAFGLVYMLIPIVALVSLLSEKRWMRLTGATELLRKL